MARSFLFAVDTILVLASVCVFVILLSGGGVFHVGALRVSARTAHNLLVGIFLVFPLRVALSRHIPFLALERMDLRNVSTISRLFCERLREFFLKSKGRQTVRVLLTVVLLSSAVKLLNAWYYYGFFSGDDVEILEMTFASLFGWDWQAANLRSAFYPMVFIYPIQAAIRAVGIESTAILVFAGRLVVVAFSGLNLWLTFEIAKRWFGSVPVGLCAMFILAFSKLHTTFAASVLPRTVSGFLVLLAAWLLLQSSRRNLCAVGAGIFLGIGAAVRFSEVVFFAPALFHLLLERRYRDASVLGAMSLITMGLVIGTSDLLYWGRPLFSLSNAVEFHLVDRLSTRAFQPFHYYLTSVPSWTNWFTVALVLMSVRLRRWQIVMWVVLPVIQLSVLPHKEPRYLLPVIPFIAVLAGAALWTLLEHVGRTSTTGSRRSARRANLAFALVLGVVLFGVDGFRFRRTEAAVDAARYISRVAKPAGQLSNGVLVTGCIYGSYRF